MLFVSVGFIKLQSLGKLGADEVAMVVGGTIVGSHHSPHQLGAVVSSSLGSPHVGALWLSAFSVAFWCVLSRVGTAPLGSARRWEAAGMPAFPPRNGRVLGKGPWGCQCPAMGSLVPHQSVAMWPDPGPLSLGFAFGVPRFLLRVLALPPMFAGCVALGRAASRPLLPTNQPGELCAV